MGSHFHGSIDYNGVALFWDFKSKKNIYPKAGAYGLLPKVTKVGSMIGHRKIDYKGVGVLRCQQHIPSKKLPN